MTAAEPALAGLTVLELTTGPAGAYCGRLLALIGADVVKVECPARPDEARRAGPFPAGNVGEETSGAHRYLHARKRSVSLDVSTPSGRAVLDRLAARADVVLDDGALGAPPVVADRYRALLAAHNQLIVAAFTPYGLGGPRAGWLATELTSLAAGGWLTSPEPDEPPVMTGSSAPAFGVGTLGAVAVLLAVVARRRHGFGQLVEIPANEALLSLLAFPTTLFAFLGRDEVRIGDRHPFGIYPCADGHLGVPILTQRHWTALCRLMGRDDLAADPELANGDLRALPGAVARIDAAIAAWATDKVALPTFEAGQAQGVPIAIIPSPRQVLQCAHYEARGFFDDVVDPVLGPLRLPGRPYLGAPGTFSAFRPAPTRGSDTAAVLGEAGYDAATIAALARAGVS